MLTRILSNKRMAKYNKKSTTAAVTNVEDAMVEAGVVVETVEATTVTTIDVPVEAIEATETDTVVDTGWSMDNKKAELLAAAEAQGLEVASTMTKTEILAALDGA